MLRLNLLLHIILLFLLPVMVKTLNGNPTENGVVKAEVELLIICDKECGDLFQHDRQKLIDYWSVYLWDVNMRFKTLQRVSISFRLTSLHLINSIKDQSFVEQGRELDGTVKLESIWEHFSKWLYVNEKNLTGFDMAVFVTGAEPAKSDEHLAYQLAEFGKTTCHKDDTNKMHLSTIVLHAKSTWGYHCASIESAFAEMLGADFDGNTDCKSDQYLMSRGPCDAKQYMFSRCSDDAILKFLKTSEASCLFNSDAVGVDVLKAATVTHPPTLDYQCVMVTENEMATAFDAAEDFGVDPCVISKCLIWDNGRWTFLRWLLPVDNSPCGDGKFCFRGRCLPQGFMLLNIGSGKCLQPTSGSSGMRYPIMVNCEDADNWTPLNQIRIQDEDRYGNNLVTASATPSMSLDGQDGQDECLSDDTFYEHSVGNLWYYPCLFPGKNYLGWDLLGLGASDTFLLRRRFSESCATVDSDDRVKLDDNCNMEDARKQWLLLNQTVIPFNLVGNKKYHLPTGYGYEYQQRSRYNDEL